MSSPAVGSSATSKQGGVSRRHRHREKVSTVLQMRMLKTKMCRWAQQGKCERGETCFFAHSEEELRRCPDLSMTRMCANFEVSGSCANGQACKFAHCEAELRGTIDFYRTAICEDWKKGACKLDAFCRFAHGHAQLHQRAPLLEIETHTRREAQTQRDESCSPSTTASTPEATPTSDEDKQTPAQLLAAALAQVGRSPREDSSSCDEQSNSIEQGQSELDREDEQMEEEQVITPLTHADNPHDYLRQLVASLAIEEVHELLQLITGSQFRRAEETL